MARIKVSDLVEIKERDIPLLVYVDPPKLPMLHISRRTGKHSRGTRLSITECNLALLHISIYHNAIIDTSQVRLCARCAGRTSFDDALAENHRLRAELAQRRKEQQAQRDREEQREREALQSRLVELHNEFLPETPIEIGVSALYVEYNGRLYEIREVTK